MKITKAGNVRIRVNPERAPEQFTGSRYYKMDDLVLGIPLAGLRQIEDNGFDLADNISNSDIISYYVLPFMELGYTSTGI